MLQTKLPLPRINGVVITIVVASCLVLAGCALSVGVTNSPDWCNNNPGNVTCR